MLRIRWKVSLCFFFSSVHLKPARTVYLRLISSSAPCVSQWKLGLSGFHNTKHKELFDFWKTLKIYIYLVQIYVNKWAANFQKSSKLLLDRVSILAILDQLRRPDWLRSHKKQRWTAYSCIVLSEYPNEGFVSVTPSTTGAWFKMRSETLLTLRNRCTNMRPVVQNWPTRSSNAAHQTTSLTHWLPGHRNVCLEKTSIEVLGSEWVKGGNLFYSNLLWVSLHLIHLCHKFAVFHMKKSKQWEKKWQPVGGRYIII